MTIQQPQIKSLQMQYTYMMQMYCTVCYFSILQIFQKKFDCNGLEKPEKCEYDACGDSMDSGEVVHGAMSAAFRVAFNEVAGGVNNGDGNTMNKSLTYGDSSFEYSIEGPVKFQEKVHQLLVDIVSSDAGATLLNEITANSGVVHIQFQPGQQAVTQGFLHNRNSNIRIDLNFKEAINSNIGPLYANPKFILAHELHHAWKNTLNCWFSCNKNLILPGKVPRGIPPVEMHALRYTNKIRTDLRAGYQRKP